jgi:heme-degrading monooxygenase HmoA
MSKIATTPNPPYYAVIFTSIRTEIEEDYHLMAIKMVEMAQEQEGYLGHESARDGLGITVSYWASLEAIKKWKMNSEHLLAQKMGRAKWYAAFKTRICLVERDYEFEKESNSISND